MGTIKSHCTTTPSNPKSDSDDTTDSINGRQLLREVEEISKALYLNHHNPTTTTSNSKKKNTQLDNVSKREGKWKKKKGRMMMSMSSLWKWKPSSSLGALTLSRRRRYDCCFFCHVHCIENLNPKFNGLGLIVNWKRKEKDKEKDDSVMETAPSIVVDGTAEFDETLMSSCSVYATSSSGNGSFVKYEERLFCAYVSVEGGLGIGLGKHWVDLTRLLPVTFEELEEDKMSGRWATSFKLLGDAKGAVLNVSFGFVLVRDNMVESGWGTKLVLNGNSKQNGGGLPDYFALLGDEKVKGTHRRVASLPGILAGESSNSSECSDVKILHEVLPGHGPEYMGLESCDVSGRFHFDLKLFKSLNPKPGVYSDSIEGFQRNESGDVEFILVDKGVELEWESADLSKSKASQPRYVDACEAEVIHVGDTFAGEKIASDEKIEPHEKDNHPVGSAADALLQDPNHTSTADSYMEEVELYFLKMLMTDNVELKSSATVEIDYREEHILDGNKRNPESKQMVRSRSLDDLTESVANDFLHLLEENFVEPAISVDGASESPKKCHWRQFEKDMDVQETVPEFSFSAPISSVSEGPLNNIDLQPSSVKHSKEDDNGMKKHARSETKAKMLERQETRSLMKKWGLDEAAFQSSPRYSTGGFGSPIMLSPKRPVPLPSLGDGIGSLVQLNKGGFLRSISRRALRNFKDGKILIMQASGPVVLPAQMGLGILDILQSMAFAGGEELYKQLKDLMPLEEVSGKTIQQIAQEASRELGAERLSDEGSPLVWSLFHDHAGSQCLSIHDLAPAALDVIEVLLIEGLRIQGGMSDDEAPSSINLKTNHEVSHPRAKIDEHSAPRESQEGKEHLLSLSISLNEWMRLDDGVFGDEIDERMLNILAAHHPYCASDRSLDGTSHKYGMMGNHLTVASMMQLRDPLRNYEPVGAPMLALVQVHRVAWHVPLSENGKATENGTQDEPMEEMEDDICEDIPRFKMSQVHLAGFDSEFIDQVMKSNRRQQWSASRWLLTGSTNKTKKLQFPKSNVIRRLKTPQATRNPESESFLWSISHDFRGAKGEWEESLAHGTFTRNPDVMLPK